MAKEINVVVTIDKTPMTDEEKIFRMAQYVVLVHKWEQKEKMEQLAKEIAWEREETDMEKFKTLFKNDDFEIVERTFRCRNGKLSKNYYVDFGRHDVGAGMQCCFIDFESKAELKDFIKTKNISNQFSNNFVKTN